MSDSDGPPRAPLSVHTDLSLTIDGTAVDVDSTGDRLFVEFPTALSAVRAVRGLSPTGRDQLRELLRTTDLTLELRVRGRTVLVSGAGSRPGPVSRELSVAPDELRVGGVLGVAGRELSALARRARRVGRRLRG